MSESPHTTVEWHSCPGSGQTKLGKMLQEPSQPSTGERLPSSHASLPSPLRKPSPQYSTCSHNWPTVEHTKPVSTWQVAEQPSVSAVLPSSHCSPALTVESPQAAFWIG